MVTFDLDTFYSNQALFLTLSIMVTFDHMTLSIMITFDLAKMVVTHCLVVIYSYGLARMVRAFINDTFTLCFVRSPDIKNAYDIIPKLVDRAPSGVESILDFLGSAAFLGPLLLFLLWVSGCLNESVSSHLISLCWSEFRLSIVWRHFVVHKLASTRAQWESLAYTTKMHMQVQCSWVFVWLFLSRSWLENEQTLSSRAVLALLVHCRQNSFVSTGMGENGHGVWTWYRRQEKVDPLWQDLERKTKVLMLPTVEKYSHPVLPALRPPGFFCTTTVLCPRPKNTTSAYWRSNYNWWVKVSLGLTC